MSADTAYRTVAEHLPDAAVVLFDPDLRLQLATGTTLPDPAWSAGHSVGRTVVDLVPAEQAATLQACYRAALAGTRQHLETPGWRGQGQYWAVDVVPLRGEDGAVSGGMAFWRDISKRHRADEALLEARQLARIGSWEWDLASDRMSWPPAPYRILGVQPGAALTRQITRELIHPDDRAMREELLAGARRDPSPIETEFRAVRPDGTVVWILAHTQGVCDPARRVVQVVGTNEDITGARQAEQERRRLLGRLYDLLDCQHRRLAADLHDGHLQSLAAIGLRLDQHADARRLKVALYRDGPRVVLVVEDDGRGFDPTHTQAVADSHGFGLTCMRERLQAIGGHFTLESAPGAGTRIQVQAAARAAS